MYRKVALYRINDTDRTYYKLEAGTIIIKINLFSCREIMTNEKILVLKSPECLCGYNKLKPEYGKKVLSKTKGLNAFVLYKEDEDIEELTEKELDEYIENFEQSRFKEIYDQREIERKNQEELIKEKKEEKVRIKNKIKEVRGSYQ